MCIPHNKNSHVPGQLFPWLAVALCPLAVVSRESRQHWTSHPLEKEQYIIATNSVTVPVSHNGRSIATVH